MQKTKRDKKDGGRRKKKRRKRGGMVRGEGTKKEIERKKQRREKTCNSRINNSSLQWRWFAFLFLNCGFLPNGINLLEQSNLDEAKRRK